MKLQPKHLYMALPVALLLMSVSIQVTAAVIASRGNDAEIERDYYDRAVNWDDYQKLVAASGELGWTVEIRPDGLLAPGAEVGVILVVKDADGNSVEGVKAHISAFQNAHVNEMHELEFDEIGPGFYHASMRPRRTGRWVWRMRLERGEEVFVGEQRAQLFAVPEAAK
jgi:hypothetical protein